MFNHPYNDWCITYKYWLRSYHYFLFAFITKYECQTHDVHPKYNILHRKLQHFKYVAYYKNKNIISLYSRRIIFPYLTTIVVGRHGNITILRISSFLFDDHDDETSGQSLSDCVLESLRKPFSFDKMREIFFFYETLSEQEENKFISILTL